MKKMKINVLIFISVALISGWLGVIVDYMLRDQQEGSTLGMGLWLISPFLAMVVLRIISKDKTITGVKFNIKQNVYWYLLAVAIYPLLVILSISVGLFFNCTANAALNAEVFFSLLITMLLASIVKNIFEEFAWRGYFTAKLIDLGLNDWVIYGISGLFWSLWHAAYYYVFLPEKYFVSTSRTMTFLLSGILMFCWAVTYTELYRLTKSVWPCVFMHAVKDVILTGFILTGGYITFTNGSDIWLNPVNGIAANVVFLLIGLLLRLVRIKKEKQLAWL